MIPNGMIDLDGCTITKEDKNTFCINSKEKNYNLKFKDEDKEKWLEWVKKILSKYRSCIHYSLARREEMNTKITCT